MLVGIRLNDEMGYWFILLFSPPSFRVPSCSWQCSLWMCVCMFAWLWCLPVIWHQYLRPFYLVKHIKLPSCGEMCYRNPILISSTRSYQKGKKNVCMQEMFVGICLKNRREYSPRFGKIVHRTLLHLSVFEVVQEKSQALTDPATSHEETLPSLLFSVQMHLLCWYEFFCLGNSEISSCWIKWDS